MQRETQGRVNSSFPIPRHYSAKERVSGHGHLGEPTRTHTATEAWIKSVALETKPESNPKWPRPSPKINIHDVQIMMQLLLLQSILVTINWMFGMIQQK